MILTDTHSHLYDQKFSEDQQEVIDRAFEENVTRIFLPNVDQHSVAGMLDITKPCHKSLSVCPAGAEP